MALIWALAPGDNIRRTELHSKYGGRQQGGISPSSESPNIFLFSDPASGLKHGYVDHWNGHHFHYTGEGQRGDQQMVSGNRAVLEHASQGRALRMFRGAGGVVEYIGEFSIDLNEPFYTTDAPETGDGPIRKVIVFKLRPEGAANVARLPAPPIDFDPGVEEVEIAETNTEKVWVDPEREPYAAELREAALVEQFKSWLKSRGHVAKRLKIVPPGEAKPLFNDIWVPAQNLLIEAKGTCTREAVRMAIGQLIDYGRVKPAAEQALLLPERPRADLVSLIEAAGITLICPQGKAFIFVRPTTARAAG